MASDFTTDPIGQTWRTAAIGQHAKCPRRLVLLGANGVRLADVAPGIPAEGHGVLLLQDVSPGWDLGTNSRFAPQTSACEAWQSSTTQCGSSRQSIGQNDGKKGACCGYDAGKKVKGRKRHLLVDTLGLIWCVVVHAASVQDRDGAKSVLEKVVGKLPRLKRIWADGGYAGQLIAWVQQVCGWVLEIVKRNDDARGFEVLPKRWIVERTFGWFGWYRRLSKDYEELTENSEAMILVCMIHRMLRHLKPSDLAYDWKT